jgi:hypothetical protein
MRLIKEPLGVDFYVDPKPLTQQDQKMISDFIKADKEKRKAEKNLRKAAITKHRLTDKQADVH